MTTMRQRVDNNTTSQTDDTQEKSTTTTTSDDCDVDVKKSEGGVDMGSLDGDRLNIALLLLLYVLQGNFF